MAQPLNQKLYALLKARFGRVRIGSAGQRFDGNYVSAGISDEGLTGEKPANKCSNKKLVIRTAGEYYQVCCDKCHDTRFRLYINHRWGVYDEHNRLNLFLVHCFNEPCYDTHEARLSLWESLFYGNLKAVTSSDIPVVTGSGPATELQLPGRVFRLDTLPAEHPACRYLANRLFDPARLGRFYGVCYCPESHYPLAAHRIIVPIMHDGRLRGWQARYIGELDWKNDPDAPPKWWTCPGTQRGQLLYNFDNAKRYHTGVVVEGPGDVWGFGPMAMACFGDTMTMEQQRLFVQTFRERSGVLLFDPDVMNRPKSKRAYDELHESLQLQFSGRLARVFLPEGTDPGSLDRTFLRNYVMVEAAKQGVVVSWKKAEASHTVCGS